MHMEVRGRLVGVGSLVAPCGIKCRSSDLRESASLPSESSRQPFTFLFCFFKTYFLIYVCVFIYTIYHKHQRPEGIKCLRAAIAVSCELGGMVLGTKPGPSAKTVSNVNSWALSLTPYTLLAIIDDTQTERPFSLFLWVSGSGGKCFLLSLMTRVPFPQWKERTDLHGMRAPFLSYNTE